MLVKDRLYGNFEIRENVLIDLLKSQPILRLKGASQQGFPAGETKTDFPLYTRYEHSVGVMLLLRKLGASLEEQVAGLLHDASHTAFSHVMDWVVGDPEEQEYQDSMLADYIKKSTLAGILTKRGFDVEKISNLEKSGNFGLLERQMPNLCADRVDYSLRDGYYWVGVNAKYCVKHLTVHRNEIVFNSMRAAKVFGFNYMKCQVECWASDEAGLRYHFISLALKEAISSGVLKMKDMYKDEKQIIAKLRASGQKDIVENINAGLGILKFIESTSGGIKLAKKLRYVDPKFLYDGRVRRLSEVDTHYRAIIKDEKARAKRHVQVRLLK